METKVRERRREILSNFFKNSLGGSRSNFQPLDGVWNKKKKKKREKSGHPVGKISRAAKFFALKSYYPARIFFTVIQISKLNFKSGWIFFPEMSKLLEIFHDVFLYSTTRCNVKYKYNCPRYYTLLKKVIDISPRSFIVFFFLSIQKEFKTSNCTIFLLGQNFRIKTDFQVASH